MNKGYQWVWLLLLITLVGSGPLVAQDSKTIWVSGAGATLKQDRTASAATLTELAVGTELTVLAYEKRWYQVSAPQGQTGWIYRGKISRNAPTAGPTTASGGESVGSLLGSLTGSTIGANTADTARSVRGLSPEAEAYARQTGSPQAHQQALDAILAFQAGDREIEKFLQNGNIGEYAR